MTATVELGALGLRISAIGFDDAIKNITTVDKIAIQAGRNFTAASAQFNVFLTALRAARGSEVPLQDVDRAITAATSSLRELAKDVSLTNAAEVESFRRLAAETKAAAQAVGAQIGQVQRLDSTVAAFERRVDAAANAQRRARAETVSNGDANDKLSPKLRSAANGLTAVAFAASAVEPNLQSMALAGGLAASSLSSVFGSASLAAGATGIGAVITIGVALVGVLQRIAQAGPPAEAVIQHLSNLRSVEAGSVALETAKQRVADLDKELDELRGNSFTEYLPVFGLLETAWKSFATMRVNSKIATAREIETIAVTKAVALQLQHERDAFALGQQIQTEEAQSHLAITKAALSSEQATTDAAYQTGRASLERHYADRRRILSEGAAAEISAVRAQAAALNAAPPGETADQKNARLAQQINLLRQIDVIAQTSRAALIQLDAEAEQAARARLATETVLLGALKAVHLLTVDGRRRAIEIEAQYRQVLNDSNAALDRRLDALQKIQAMQQAGTGLGVGPTLGGVKGASGIDTGGKITISEGVKDQLKQYRVDWDEQIKIFEKAAAGDTHAILAVGLADALSSGLSAGIEGAINSGSITGGLKALARQVVGSIAGLMAEVVGKLIPLMALWAKIRTWAFAHPLGAIAASIALIALAAALSAASSTNPDRGSSGSFGGSADTTASAIQVALGPRAAPLGAQAYTVTPGVPANSGRTNTLRPVQPIVIHHTSLGRFSDDEARKLAAAVDSTRSRGRG